MAVSKNKMADTDEKIFIGKGEQPAWQIQSDCRSPPTLADQTQNFQSAEDNLMLSGAYRGRSHGTPVRLIASPCRAQRCLA